MPLLQEVSISFILLKTNFEEKLKFERTTFYFKMFYLNEQRIDADGIHSFENNLMITYTLLV
jgi:hypothetical protein